MKLIKIAVLCVWALACGGVDLEEYEDALQSDVELGVAEQAITFEQQSSPAGLLNPLWGGVRFDDVSPNDASCSKLGSPTSNCYHPSSKTIKIKCTDGTLGPVLDAIVASANGTLGGSGWTISHNNAAGFNVEIVNQAIANNFGPDNVDTYVDTTVTLSGAALAEPVAINGVHRVWGGLKAFVDVAKINARGANANEDLILLRHGLARVFLTAVDVGGRQQLAPAFSSFASERIILPLNTTKILFTAGEACRSKKYLLTPTGSALLGSSGNCPS